MEKLQTVTHPQFGQLSVIILDGKEMFKAKEVASMLGYKDTINAVKQHCKGVVKHDLPSKSGNQEYSLIPESDVWRLIIRSKLPQAEAIERWIMDDVLPSIRKTGTYSVSKQPTQQKLYDYRDKTYKGKPVLTIRDVEHFTSLSKYRIQHFIQRTDKGQDFIILTGNELAAFKYENSMPDSNANHLYLVTKSGFDKFCAAYGLKPKMPELFIETTPPVSSKKTECLRLEKVLVQENKKFQRHIKDLTCCLKAMESLLFLVNDDNLSPESVKYKTNSIADLAASIAGGALALSSTKFETRIVEY